MAKSLVSVYQGALTGQIFFPGSELVELEISGSPVIALFAWTLTHPSCAFSQIEPVFNSREEFLKCVITRAGERQIESAGFSCTSAVISEVTQIALEKIDNEWKAWVNVHADHRFDECKLDNMLMAVLYRIILDRDLKRCVLCETMSDLTIHHIIRKRRNIPRTTPPFGRSVPTNLITLCRSCHSFFDPMILA